MFFCNHLKECGGCKPLALTYSEQLALKTRYLRELLQASLPNHRYLPTEVTVRSIGETAQRVRSDLTIKQNKLGFYSKNSSEIVSIEDCSHYSQELKALFSLISKKDWPILRGSLRLRVSPNGHQGIWLDFGNLDIMQLLIEQKFLEALLDIGFVEVGQRAKTLVRDDSQLRLMAPSLNPWFQTWDMKGRPIELSSYVRSFTQPSLTGNWQIIQELHKWCSQLRPSRVLEWGSGIGNLTLAIKDYCEHLWCLENDPLSVQALRWNLEFALKDVTRGGRNPQVDVYEGDFQSLHVGKLQQLKKISSLDLLVANPPRSGLRHFLEFLRSPLTMPKALIYLSCYPPSFAKDTSQLIALGYNLEKIILIDQFPQTPHFEVLTLFVK